MNCNDEFVVKALGKLTLEFNFDWQQQLKANELIHLALYNYNVLPVENALVASDLHEKIKLYLEVRKLEGYSMETLKNYFYVLIDFANIIVKPATTVTKNDIRYYLAYKSNEGKFKPSTINNKISILKAFFQWLDDEEIIMRNPCRQIKLTKLPKRLRTALNTEELERLRIACITERERALVEFLFATGCRVSELVKANIDDIDFAENSLRVVGKGDKQRMVYFSDKTRLYLKNYIKSRRDNDEALFVSDRFPHGRLGRRGIEVIISKIASRTEINKSVYPHLLRHTCATLALKKGADITTIQHILGHESPSTTQTYAEMNEENLKHEYNQHFIQ